VKYLATTLILAALGLAACGESTSTTVIKEPATTEATTTTQEASAEWPQYLQRAFLSGCGGSARCDCALDELMQAIPADEFDPTGNVIARYRSQMQAAVEACV
jgi:hypothetical protein